MTLLLLPLTNQIKKIGNNLELVNVHNNIFEMNKNKNISKIYSKQIKIVVGQNDNL